LDPAGVVHVGAGVGIRNRPVAALAAGVADEEEAAARLGWALAIAHQEYAVAVEHLLGPAGLENPLVPRRLFRPAETRADRPAGGERRLNLPQFAGGQTCFRVPSLDPVQP